PQGADLPTHIQQILDVCSALTRRVKNLENDKAAQKLEIVKLKARVVTTAKLIIDVVTAASQVTAASATIPAAGATIPAAALTVVAAYTRRRKGVIIRDPEEELSS
nr:hypothetical protein [Tanacetum cinerariifolium]